MIAIPEKEHSHSKKHDTVTPFRQGDGGTQGQQADILPLCPSSVSNLQPVCLELGQNLLAPLAFRDPPVQHFFYRAEKQGEGAGLEADAVSGVE